MAKDESPSTSLGTAGTVPRVSLLGKEINQLQALSPRLAAEKAVIAFLQPPRIHPNSHQRSLLSTAETSRVQIDGKEIFTYTWAKSAKSPTVLLSHGYGANAAAMLNFVQPLLDADLRVVAWDHTGHGESEGDWGDLRVFIHTIKTMALRYSPLAAIIGHSGGATMAVMALAENPLIICPRLICLSPPTQVDTLISTFLNKNGCRADLAPQMQQIMAGRNILSPAQVRSVQINHVGIQAKMLVVQDRDDKVVPVTDAEWLAGAVANSRLEITKGSGHSKVLDNPQIVQLVTRFVIGRSPSSLAGSLKL